jgi:hypothetical protein
MLESQHSRYGAISRIVPDLAPGSKMFLVCDSDDTTVGPLNIGAEFPVDKDGVARVYTTIQAAVNAGSASRADIALVLPGYDQSVTGADSWNCAGMTIRGIGNGNNRPTIRYTGKSGEVGLGANNVKAQNIRFLAATDSIVRAVDMDTGFTGQALENCVFDFDSTTNDFRVMLRMGSKKAVVEGNRFLAEDTAGCGKAISILGGAPSGSQIKNNFFYGQFDTLGDTSNGAGVIVQDTTDTSDTNLSGLMIKDNVIVSTDTAATSILRMSAGYTIRGIFTGNRIATYDSAVADTVKIIGGGLRFIDNIISSDSGTEHRVGDTTIAA